MGKIGLYLLFGAVPCPVTFRRKEKAREVGCMTSTVIQGTPLGRALCLAHSALRLLFKSILKTVLLSNLCTQYGSRTYDPEVKSCMVFGLSQPGAITEFIIILFLNSCFVNEACWGRGACPGAWSPAALDAWQPAPHWVTGPA